ncbi:MAG TPA: MFS transporter [Blastocatellia bacterium]|nr:MFS transporter [Blastocatellia bacterium]
MNLTGQKTGRLRRILGATSIDTAPLRVSREYRLLYIGQFVSSFGSAISYVVLPWQMYQLTRSTFAVGMLGVAEFIPMLVLAFVGGALADYIDRRRLVLLAEAALAVLCAALAVNSLLPQPRAWMLILMAALFAACNALHRPAIEALTPRIVPLELMPAVAALGAFRYSVTFIVGASLAGVITSKFGAGVGYIFDAATFIVSFVMLLLMRAVPPPEGADRPSLRSIKDGLLYARSRQELLGTYLIDIIAMFFGMPMALFPAIAERLGNASVGLLYAMPAVGAMLVTLTSGWLEKVNRHGLAVTLSVVVWGLAIIGFGLATSLWAALVCLIVAFAADMVSGMFRMTIWNQTIPDHLRGRLASIEMISYLTGPYLGNAEAGLVASLFGLRASVVSGGVMCVIGAGLLALFLPGFIRYDGREGLKQKELEEAERAATISASQSILKK